MATNDVLDQAVDGVASRQNGAAPPGPPASVAKREGPKAADVHQLKKLNVAESMGLSAAFSQFNQAQQQLQAVLQDLGVPPLTPGRVYNLQQDGWLTSVPAPAPQAAGEGRRRR